MKISSTRSKPATAPVGQINGAAPAAPIGPIAPVPKLRQPGRTRRPLMLALMVLTIVLGALGSLYFLNKSTERVAVVALSRDVAWGQVLTAFDVTEVSIVADPALHPVTWADKGDVLGERTTTDLLAGSLLTSDAVTASAAVPGVGQALVGVLLKAGQMPATQMGARDHVLLVVTAQAGASTTATGATVEPKTVAAIVFTVAALDATGSSTVDVLVPQANAADIASAAALGRVAVVLVPRS